MALDPRLSRRRPVTLTPLIDIIFLLLLFFMLSSTFTRFAEVPLMNAGAGHAEGTPPLFLQLREGDLSLNGRSMPLDALVAAIRDAKDGETATVLVTVSANVTSQRLVDLLSRLRTLADLSVSILD